MIGVVSRVDDDGVYVEKLASYPGQELGPLLAVTHRIDVGVFTTYAPDDRVHVVEDTSNEFIVTGIIQGGGS